MCAVLNSVVCEWVLQLHTYFRPVGKMQTLDDRVFQLEALCASLSTSIAALSRITQSLTTTTLQTSETMSMVLANPSNRRNGGKSKEV